MPRVPDRARILPILAFAALTLSACSTGAATSRPTVAAAATAPTPAMSTAPASTPAPTAPPPPELTLRASLDGDLPKGWDVAAEGTLLSFATSGDGPGMAVELLRNRAVMAENCGLEPEPGVATTAKAIVSAVAARRGLTASKPKSVRVGRLSGYDVELQVEAGFDLPCPGEDGAGFVPLFGAMESYGWAYAGVGAAERIRLVALDVADNENLVILVTAPDAATYDRLIGDASSIIDRLVFATSL
jgi:hypothetical protein